ncbi:MAG TPA: hypothetical protein VFV01_18725 [Spirillospora sp.]|nr:hypothetical protein [Spirillospora sp.]
MVSTSRAGDERLAALGAAAAGVLRTTDYHLARTEDIAAAVSVDTGDQDGRSRRGRRSAVWVYSEVKSRRVLVALALYHAWLEYQERSGGHPVAARCETLHEARAQVSAALTEVVRFHRVEARLVERVGFGIGDISTAEKRRGTNAGVPVWPDTVIGAVAEEGYAMRIGAFTAFLAPFLRGALESVAGPTADEVERCARSLSNLVFRACLADPDGPIDRTVEALTAFWFERDLVRLAGTWTLDLDGAERNLAATARRRTDPRAEGYARAALIRVLLEAGTLHRRGAAEGEVLTASFTELTGWPRPRADAADLAALCDAASRWALSLRRFGDLAAARTADELSLRVADDGAGDASIAARARSNLGETLSMAGADAAALDLLRTARGERAALLAAAPEDGGERERAWRRLRLTEQMIAAAHIRAGRVTEALRSADEILADLRSRPAPPPGMLAGARLLHAEALLAAGHPAVARESALAVYQDPHTLKARSGLRLATVILLMARIARAAGRPETAVRLLADGPVLTAWFAERVSARTGADARRVLGAALAESGDTARGLEELTAAKTMLPGSAGDPLAVLIQVELAGALAAHGDPGGARAAIDAVLAQDDVPATLNAKALLARNRLAPDEPDDSALRAALALPGLDPVHPLLLTARVDLAERLVGRGDLHAAMELLEPFAGARPLEHGRALLGVDHPLLRRAIAVLDRIGVAHGWGPLPAPLALD